MTPINIDFRKKSIMIFYRFLSTTIAYYRQSLKSLFGRSSTLTDVVRKVLFSHSVVISCSCFNGEKKCDVTLHMVALFLDDNKTNDDGDGNENGKT